MVQTVSGSVRPVVTEEQKQQFLKEGYFILERAISPEWLELLRKECHHFIDTIDNDMKSRGVKVDGTNHLGKRYFIANRHAESDVLQRFLFSETMADICRATLGDEAYLFVEQFVVKAAEVGMKFGWHQDSGYVGHPHTPYLSCWCALDDMSIENGTIFVLPYSRENSRKLIQHVKEEGSNDLVGYHGDDPGIPCIVPAGSIVVFSSLLFHRSGSNSTSNWRRSYLVQYSPEPVLDKAGVKPWSLAAPFLHKGEIVAETL